MELALIVLGIIMCVFFIILCCQCFSRVMWEFSEKSEQFVENNHYKRMPPPAYVRNKGNNV
ncbi:hypothetical protein B4U80_04983 [Leptotrombidium deliense]|uniref:Uncharacterized protein n=1 Tax=Leptotrombidium deliense TaxID=299467 RepID=A0A443SJA1_9ACAR|nr:hypothetical protein B4U80_04983 [Leptotrombidium deliense]